MNKNEATATKRRVGPIPYFDNDGKPLSGLAFVSAAGQVFTTGDGGAEVAAAANVVEIGAGQYYYEFSQAETNYSSFIGVRLTRPGITGASSAVAPNSLTDSTNTLVASKYVGQYLIDSAGTRWLITANTTHVYTLAGTGSPAAGAYSVDAYRDVSWGESIDKGLSDASVASIFDGNTKLEGGATPGDIMRLMAGVLAGKANNFSTGTITFKSLDGSKTRLTGTVDSSGRLSITLGDLTA